MTQPPRSPVGRTPTPRRLRLDGADRRKHAARRPVTRGTSKHAIGRGAPSWLLGGAAAGTWLIAIALLGVAATRSPDLPVTPVLRVLLPLVWALAAGLVFLPLRHALDAPGLGWQGVVGWTLLGYVLAFVPAPSGALLELPELPSYLLLFLAAFYASISTALPFAWLVAQRRLADPDQRLRRARRQATLVMLVVMATLVLAGLRVLTPWAIGLVCVALVIVELLFITQVDGS